ncbi:hypothetical protein N9L29_01000 [Litoricolaceae bacterium]|nr:hypothetical protein [Litorivicinaceae bacterium]
MTVDSNLTHYFDLLVPGNSVQLGGGVVFSRRKMADEIEAEINEMEAWVGAIFANLPHKPYTSSDFLKALRQESISKTRRLVAIFSEIYFGDEAVFETIYGSRNPLAYQVIKIIDVNLDALILPVKNRQKGV